MNDSSNWWLDLVSVGGIADDAVAAGAKVEKVLQASAAAAANNNNNNGGCRKKEKKQQKHMWVSHLIERR